MSERFLVVRCYPDGSEGSPQVIESASAVDAVEEYVGETYDEATLAVYRLGNFPEQFLADGTAIRPLGRRPKREVPA